MTDCSLTKEQLDRYRGHISLCEIDRPGQEAICRSKVLIVGVGGLGSPVALYLAAAGVGHIGLVDADTVSLSNLQRQIIHGTPDIGIPKTESAESAMLRINPHITVTTHPCYLTEQNAEEILGAYELIIDCTDHFESRLLINDACVRIGKPFVFGSVSRFKGLVFTHVPGSCDFRTYFGQEMSDNNEPCVITGILNSVVGVIGSLQATEAIKYITHTGDLLTNRLLVFDAITMQFDILDISK